MAQMKIERDEANARQFEAQMHRCLLELREAGLDCTREAVEFAISATECDPRDAMDVLIAFAGYHGLDHFSL